MKYSELRCRANHRLLVLLSAGHSISLSPTHTQTRARTHTHTHTHSLSHFLSFTQALCLSLAHFESCSRQASFSLSVTHTHTVSLPLFLSFTQSRCLSIAHCKSRSRQARSRVGSVRSAKAVPSTILQGYLAYKKQHPPLGPPKGSRYGPTVGS